jgi:hypothetical protein
VWKVSPNGLTNEFEFIVNQRKGMGGTNRQAKQFINLRCSEELVSVEFINFRFLLDKNVPRHASPCFSPTTTTRFPGAVIFSPSADEFFCIFFIAPLSVRRFFLCSFGSL